jgi:hypothetical protein
MSENEMGSCKLIRVVSGNHPNSDSVLLVEQNGEIRKAFYDTFHCCVRSNLHRHKEELYKIFENLPQPEFIEKRHQPKQKVETNQESCYYCGCKATSFGAFGEPVCPDCGG